MQELIPIQDHNGSKAVSARDLHNFLSIEERFSRWAGRMFEYGFEEGIDYTPYQNVHPQNLQELEDFALTIDCAKQISMLQRNHKGQQARQYFIECEKKLKSVIRELSLRESLELNLKLLEEREAAQQKVLVMTPKAEAYDDLMDAVGNHSFQEVAAILNIKGLGRNNLIAALRDKKILQKNNVPYRNFIESGYFITRERPVMIGDVERVNTQTFVTPKGLDWIRKNVKHGN